MRKVIDELGFDASVPTGLIDAFKEYYGDELAEHIYLNAYSVVDEFEEVSREPKSWFQGGDRLCPAERIHYRKLFISFTVAKEDRAEKCVGMYEWLADEGQHEDFEYQLHKYTKLVNVEKVPVLEEEGALQ